MDTGQSSSLVAVHLAGESLRTGESDLAIAGGVNLTTAPENDLVSAKPGALSPDGRCYTFDARANGYVRGEGGGVVALDTLQRALAGGHRIRNPYSLRLLRPPDPQSLLATTIEEESLACPICPMRRGASGLERHDEGDLVRFDVVGDGVVRMVRVPPDEAGFWTEEWQAGERRADADLAAGRGRLFHSAEDMFADLGGC